MNKNKSGQGYRKHQEWRKVAILPVFKTPSKSSVNEDQSTGASQLQLYKLSASLLFLSWSSSAPLYMYALKGLPYSSIA